jgi:hypothetical protein
MTMHLLPDSGSAWQQVHGHLAPGCSTAVRPRRQLPTGLPALLAQDLGDLTGEVAAGHVTREEPKDDVLPRADQPVLPRRVTPYLAIRPVVLVRVDLDDQPAPVAEVPDEVGSAKKTPPGIEEVALQVVGRDAGVVAPQPCVALGRRLRASIGQRQPNDDRERSLAVRELTADPREVLRPDQALVQCAVQAGDRLVPGQRRQRLDQCEHHRDHLAAVHLNGLQPGSVLPEDDPVPGPACATAREGRLGDDPAG